MCSVPYALFRFPSDADYKMCGGGGRCGGKDLFIDLLHNQQVPFRICAYGECMKLISLP